MKRYLLAILICCIAVSAVYADEPQKKEAEKTDSTKVNTLDEVVVEGASGYLTPTKSVYTPTKKMKENSATATDLLMRMTIPELSVSPVDGIKTLAGKDVKVFINYLPAEEADQQTINIADVKRVEYLDFPGDPRFQGAEHVVNFIVQEYEYGGYTKLYNRVDYSNKWRDNATAFTRFSYKRLTTDLFAGFNFRDDTHKGSSLTQTYRFPQADGSMKEIVRQQRFLDSKNIGKSVPLSLRLTYNTDKVTIRNSFGYNHSSVPTNWSRGDLMISTSPEESIYRNSSSSLSNSFYWNGDFFFILPHDWSFNISNTFSYGHNNNRSGYLSELDGFSLTNNSRENSYSNDVILSMQKKFSQSHSLNVNYRYMIDYSHVEYFGDNQMIEHYAASDMTGGLKYDFNNQNIHFDLAGGLEWNGHRVNGSKEYHTSPYASTNFIYSFNPKNRLGLFAQYAMCTTTASALAPITIQQNEFMYQQGNPDAKQYKLLSWNLNYTWLPSDMFYLSFFGDYTGFYNRLLKVYSVMPDREAIVSKYINSGNFQEFTLGSTFAFRYKDKLTLNVQPRISFMHLTGAYRHNYAPFYLQSYGSYNFGNFSVGYFLHLNKVSVDLMEDSYTKQVVYHQFDVRWGKNGFTAHLALCNPFRNSYKFVTSEINTPLFSSYEQRYSNQYNRSVVLELTYTFGYGKKIERGNELNKLEGGSSAVMN